jgi:hypothetical protein
MPMTFHSEPAGAAQHAGSADFAPVARRVRSEYMEMPGLKLTEDQARRLWGLDEPTCAALLASLVETGFLIRTRDGKFLRS